MKALVLKNGTEFLIEERPMPEPNPGEVLVKSYYCGICGTDLHAPDLDTYVHGVVAGHEFAGEVEAVGPGVEGWNAGDRVTINPNGNVCGCCNECLNGWPNLCSNLEMKRSIGVKRDGGMAPYVSLPATTLHKLPDEVSMLEGAWVEPLAVALRGVSRSGFVVGRRAVVVGAGPIGLLTVNVLRQAGAGDITVIEPSAARRSKAKELGANLTIDPMGEDVASLFEGDLLRPEFVFECSAAPTGLNTAVDVVMPHGVIILVGMATGPVGLHSANVVRKEITLKGSIVYVEEFPMAIEMLAKKAIDVSTMTSEVVSLDSYEDAFERLRRGEAIKILIQLQ